MAGSTGAVVYIRPALAGALTVDFKTGAVVYVALRFASGVFAGGSSVTTRDNATTLKAWLPSSRTPVTQPDGSMTPAWYRFFDYLVNNKLGGAMAPSISDVTSSVTGVQKTVTAQVTTIANIDAKSTQNASALAATVEVVKSANLPGAQQIPAVFTSTVEESKGE